MNRQTAAARKASASLLLSILSEEEAKDVTAIVLDDVTARFMNLKGSSFKPESVKVYKSRVENAIRDFKAYKADSLGFRPTVEKGRRPATGKNSTLRNRETSRLRTEHSNAQAQTEGIVFPIPLRSDVTVKIAPRI